MVKLEEQIALGHREEGEQRLSQHGLKETMYLRGMRTKLLPEDFKLKVRLGEGNYGKVFLVTKNDTGEVLALKVLNKAGMESKNRWRRAKAEREVLASGLSRWFVRLAYSFQDKERLYLAMEFAPGGDLCSMIENIGCMNEEHVRFYIAEMTQAVMALHELGFIHRDLKPANFLVDKDGHLKLTDFGLSKKAVAGFVLQGSCEVDPPGEAIDPNESVAMVDFKELQKQDMRDKGLSPTAAAVAKAYSCVGSPDYMAPEMLKGRGYDESVDYWSLGCIAFEFLTGTPPFHRETREETFHSILNWETISPIAGEHAGIGPVVADLVNRLVCDKSNRLSKSSIQRHDFFQGIDWTNLVASIEPPFAPQLTSPYDTTYFSAQPCGTFETELGSPSQPTPRGQTHFQSPPEQMAFAGYSFKKFPSNSNNPNFNKMAQDVQKRAKAYEQAKKLAGMPEDTPSAEQCTVGHSVVQGPQLLQGADVTEEVDDDDDDGEEEEDLPVGEA